MGIERIFLRHNLPAEVQTGEVNHATTTYRLQTQLSTGLNRLRTLANDLKLALGSSNVQIEQFGDEWEVEVSNPEQVPVDLLDLLDTLPSLPLGVAALGVSDDTRPVLLNLFAEDTAHVLIMGGSQAGKTSLLRTFALSLAMTHKQSQVQLVLIEPSLQNQAVDTPGVSLAPLAYLPHVLAATISEEADIVDSLEFLTGEMAYRRKQGISLPRIVVCVDQLASLLELGDKRIKDSLSQLLHKGAQSGIHVVASTSRPEAKVVTELLKTTAPVRIVGQVATEQLAQLATGQTNSHAESLLGQGDFLAVTGDATVRFQGAFIGDYDLHLCLDDLHRQRPPAMIAQQFDTRPGTTPDPIPEETPPAPPIIQNLTNDTLNLTPITLTSDEFPTSIMEEFAQTEIIIEDPIDEAFEEDDFSSLNNLPIVDKSPSVKESHETPLWDDSVDTTSTTAEPPVTEHPTFLSAPPIKPAEPKPHTKPKLARVQPKPIPKPQVKPQEEPTIERQLPLDDLSWFDDMDEPTEPRQPRIKPRPKPILQNANNKKPKLKRVKSVTAKPAVRKPLTTKKKAVETPITPPKDTEFNLDEPENQDTEDFSFDGQIIDLAPID